MLRAKDAALFFAWLSMQQDEEKMLNTRLNKLLYFAQGHKLGETGEALFSNQIDAWQYGPVVPAVYGKFDQIVSGATDDAVDALSLPPEDVELMLNVWDAYGGYTARRLTEITHRPETPWAAVYQPDVKNNHIPTELMKAYFSAPEHRLARMVTPAREESIISVLPKEWYDPNEDAVWEAYLRDE